MGWQGSVFELTTKPYFAALGGHSEVISQEPNNPNSVNMTAYDIDGGTLF